MTRLPDSTFDILFKLVSDYDKALKTNYVEPRFGNETLESFKKSLPSIHGKIIPLHISNLIYALIYVKEVNSEYADKLRNALSKVLEDYVVLKSDPFAYDDPYARKCILEYILTGKIKDAER